MTQPTDFGGGLQDTTVSAVGAVMLVAAVSMVLILPRKYLAVPVLLATLLIPHGEVVVINGFHLMPTRILALFGWLKILPAKLSSGSPMGSRLNFLDVVFSCWALVTALAVVVLWMQTPAAINQAGFLWSTLGMYFLLRFAIADDADIDTIVKTLAIVAAVNGLGMIYEHVRLQNLFGIIIGGVESTPLLREGRVRAQGAFGHAILAGVFGATLLPLFLDLWVRGKSRAFAVIGIISSTVMTLMSASSTPVMAYAAAVLGICLWPVRESLRVLRWALVVILLALHLTMKAPVWFLIARIDVVGGSASFDRAYLIDTFIRHFSDWWLIGTNKAGSWGWSMWDLSNRFVAVGEGGGLLALGLFIALISMGFSRLGRARIAAVGDRKLQWSAWLLGCSLFAHVVAFFGVSYWDQTENVWLAVLAIISVRTAIRTTRSEVTSADDEESPWAYAWGDAQGGTFPDTAREDISQSAKPSLISDADSYHLHFRI